MLWYLMYNTEEQYILNKVTGRNVHLVFVPFADVNIGGEVLTGPAPLSFTTTPSVD